jgi:hypothetical protein
VDEGLGGYSALRPPELGAVNPNPMQDDSQFAGNRNFGLCRANPLH